MLNAIAGTVHSDHLVQIDVDPNDGGCYVLLAGCTYTLMSGTCLLTILVHPQGLTLSAA